jgi:hypothetical protein
MKQLIGQSERLKEKGVLVIAVQVSQVDGEMLNGWLDKNESTFVVGTIEGDIEKVRFKWGAKTIPWLMLADSNGIVVTEGFSIYELEDKLKATNQQ